MFKDGPDSFTLHSHTPCQEVTAGFLIFPGPVHIITGCMKANYRTTMQICGRAGLPHYTT